MASSGGRHRRRSATPSDGGPVVGTRPRPETNRPTLQHVLDAQPDSILSFIDMVSVREFRAVSSWARRNVADCRSWDDEQTVYRNQMGYLIHYTVTSIHLWLASFPYARSLCVRDWPISATPTLHSLVHLRLCDNSTATAEALAAAIDAGALPSLRVFDAPLFGERDRACEAARRTASRRLGASLAALPNLHHVVQHGVGPDDSDNLARAFFEGLSTTTSVTQLTLDATHDWDILQPFGRRLAFIEKLWLLDDFVVDPAEHDGVTLWEMLARCTALKFLRFTVIRPATVGGPIHVSLPSLTHVWMVDSYGDKFAAESFADEVRALTLIAPQLRQIVLVQPQGGPVRTPLSATIYDSGGSPQNFVFGSGRGRELRYGYNQNGYNSFMCDRAAAVAVAVRRTLCDWAFKACLFDASDEPLYWDSEADSIIAGCFRNCRTGGVLLSPRPNDVWPSSPCFASDGALFSPQHGSFSLQIHKVGGLALQSTTAVDVRSMHLGRSVHWAAFAEAGPTPSESRLLLAEGTMRAAARPPGIVSLRPDTLAVDWRTDIPGGCFGMAALPQQGVAVVAADGGLGVVCLSDGSLVGVFPTPCEQVYVAADAFSGLVFSGDSNVEHTCVNVWTWSPAGGPSGRGELVSAGILPSAGAGTRNACCAGKGGPPRPMAVMPAVPGDPDVTGHLIVGSHLNCTLRVIALPSLAHVHTYDVALPGHPTMGAGIVGLAADPRGKTLAVSIAAGDLVDFALQLLPWPLPGSA